MTLGEKIRELREARRLSQAALARELNNARWGIGSDTVRGTCTGHYVYRWEKGIRHPEDWLPHLEQVLEVDLSGYGESPEPDTDVLDLEGLVPPVDRRASLEPGRSPASHCPPPRPWRRAAASAVLMSSARASDWQRCAGWTTTAVACPSTRRSSPRSRHTPAWPLTVPTRSPWRGTC
ncbi:helix-turn-helix transcriptional regulator [Streptomyces sp. NPDC093085]|uniref:helix-turn-helix domain-containing protein n=1 Tax=Streptomyces sp. NPDC093085 TaxID=3155068 RepID=UPI00343301A5